MKCQLKAKSGTVLDFKAWSSSYNTKSDSLVASVSGASLGGAERAINYPYLTQLSVTLVGMGIDAARGAIMTNTISVTIEPPYEEWVELIEDYVDVFTDGTLVTVQLGYAGGDGFLSQEFTGTLTVVNVDLSADFVSMTIQAAGNAWNLTRRQGVLSTEGRTIIEVVRQILDTHGCKLYYLDDQSNLTRLAGTTPFMLSSLDNTLSEIVEGDDYVMLKELIQSHANLDFYMMGSQIIIYNQESQAAQPFVPTFVFRGGPKQGAMPIADGVYPCLTFSNADTQSVIKRGAAAVEAQRTDLDTKSEETISVLKEDTGLSFLRPFGLADVVNAITGIGRLGDDGLDIDGTAAALRGQALESAATALNSEVGASAAETAAASLPHRDDQRGLYVPVGDSDPSAKSKLVGLKRLAEGMSGLQSSWSTLGNPLLLPGQHASVKGVSRLFEGRYELTKVVHSGSLSGYETQLDGKTIGKYTDKAVGNEDTRGKAAQASPTESKSTTSSVDTQIKKAIDRS
jgi:hypothetical protein